MTATEMIARIDILDAPNLEGLLLALDHSTSFEDAGGQVNPEMARFDEVIRFDSDDRQLDARPALLFAYVVGIHRVGNRVGTNQTQNYFVLTIVLDGVNYQGHLDVHARKGSLRRVR